MAMRMQRRALSTAVRAAVAEASAALPTKSALRARAQDARWNLSALSEHSGALASGLLDAGLRPGQTVAAALSNSVEHVAVQLGAGSAGLRLADASTAGKALTANAVKEILSKQEVSLLVVEPSQLPAVYEAVPELLKMPQATGELPSLPDYPNLRYVLQTGLEPQPGTYRFCDMLMYNALTDELSPLPESADAPLLVPVDAASGAAAGEPLTQKQALEAAAAAAKQHSIVADSCVYFEATKDSSRSLLIATLACVQQNAQLVIPDTVPSAEASQAAKAEDPCDVVLK